MLLVGLTAQFLLVMALYPGYLQYVVSMATLALATNVIFPFTYGSAALLFLAGVYILRLEGPKAVLLSVSQPFAATSLFEMIYRHLDGGEPLYGDVVNLSAIAFGFVCLPYWRPGRVFYSLLASYVILWTMWFAIGFPPNDQPMGLALNIVIKVMSFLLYGVLTFGNGGPACAARRSTS